MAATPDRCLPAIQRILGEAFKEDDLPRLRFEVQRRMKLLRADRKATSTREAALIAAEQLGNEAKLAGVIEKRNAALKIRKRLERHDYLSQQWGQGKWEHGLQSTLTTSTRIRKGSAWQSTANAQQVLRDTYLDGLSHDLTKAKLDKLWAAGELEADISEARIRLNGEKPSFDGLDPRAVEMAKIVKKWQDKSVLDANTEGSYIGKEPSYVFHQEHNPWLISAAGEAEWTKEFVLRFKYEDSIPFGMTEAQFLHETYLSVSSGKHEQLMGAELTDLPSTMNLAKKMSQERVFIPRSARDAVEYNRKFGAQTLRNAVYKHLERMARNTGLMQKWGDNPRAEFDQTAAFIEGQITDPKEAASFRAALGTWEKPGWLRHRMLEVDGSRQIPGNHMWARYQNSVIEWERMSHLGAVVTSSLNDPFSVGMTMRYQGQSLLGGMTNALGAIVKGRPEGERLDFLARIGVGFNALAAELNGHAALDPTIPGAISRTHTRYFKWNLLNRWTEPMRFVAALDSTMWLAQNSGKAFDKLDANLARVLDIYGISKGRWEILRNAAHEVDADGNKYLMPEAVQDIPDEHFVKFLTDANVEATPGRIDRMRRELEQQVRTLYNAEAHRAVNDATSETRATLAFGTSPGTVPGIVASMVTLFKSYPINFMKQHLGREIYGRGSDTFGEALKGNNGEMEGLATLIIGTTLAGYLSVMATDLRKGKTPRNMMQNPDDDGGGLIPWVDIPVINEKVLIAALLKGGGLGIYGDFLFGETSKYGTDPLVTAAGPVAGLANHTLELFRRAREGDDVAAATFRTVVDNVPYANLFYARAAMDYLLLYRIQEALNPGYLRRMERNALNSTGQEFFVPPSEVIP